MPAPANDNIASLEVITGALPITVTGNCASATLEAGEITPIYDWAGFGRYVAGTNSVWYAWNCTTSTDVRIFVDASFSRGIALGVYTNSSLPTITTNSTPFRWNSEGIDGDNMALLYFPASSGQTYYFQLLGETATGTSSGGVFTITISTMAANALRTNATLLVGNSGTVNGTTLNSVREQNAPWTNYFPDKVVWYKWVAATDLNFSVTVETTNIDANLIPTIFFGTGALNTMVKVAGDPTDWCSSGDPKTISFKADSGIPYHLMVEELDNALPESPFTLTYIATTQTTASSIFSLVVNSTVSSLISSMAPNTQIATAVGPIALSAGDVLFSKYTQTGSPNIPFWKVSYVCNAGTNKQILMSDLIATGSGLAGGFFSVGQFYNTAINTSNFIVSAPGTFKELVVRQVGTNSGGSGTTLVTMYKNGTASSLTITANTLNGIFVDSVNTVPVTMGDRIIIFSTRGSGGGASCKAALSFYPDTAGDAMFGMEEAGFYNGMGPVYGALGRDVFDYFQTEQTLDGTRESYNAAFVAPLSGTIKNLIVSHARNVPFVTNVSMSYAINKNGTRSAVSATILGPASTAFDTANTLPVAPGDLITVEGYDVTIPNTNISSTGSVRLVVGYTYNVASSTKFPLLGYMGYNATTGEGPFYIPVNGRSSQPTQTATEATGILSGWSRIAPNMTIDSMLAYVSYPPYFTSSSTSTGSVNTNDTWNYLSGNVFANTTASAICLIDNITDPGWDCVDLPSSDTTG